MKVLVATERTQGDLAGDYDYCVPGELLWLPMVCDADRRDPSGGCGCGRGFGGLTSHRATTTGEVVERVMFIRDEAANLAWMLQTVPEGQAVLPALLKNSLWFPEQTRGPDLRTLLPLLLNRLARKLQADKKIHLLLHHWRRFQ